MSESDLEFVSRSESYVSDWFGVAPPNEVALRQAAQLLTVCGNLRALRGSLEFDAEPSAFEAALRECRETGSQ